MFNLFRQLLLDISLHSSKQEGSEDRLELLHYSKIKALVLINGLREGIRKPLFKVLLVGENVRHQEVHQRPQFHYIVLKRSSCQQEPSFGVEPQHSLPSLTFEVFDVLCLVKDHIIPLLSSESKVVLNHQLVRSDTNVK